MNKETLAILVTIQNQINLMIEDAEEYYSEHNRRDNYIIGYISAAKKARKIISKLVNTYGL